MTVGVSDNFECHRATYENHLRELVKQHVGRVSVILGPLGQLHANIKTSPALPASPSLREEGVSRSRPTQSMVDADVTRSVVPLVHGDIPRFHTLPVPMPASASGSDRPSAPVFDDGESWLSGKSDSNRASTPWPASRWMAKVSIYAPG